MSKLTAILKVTPELRAHILEFNEVVFNVDDTMVDTIKVNAVADFSCTFDRDEELTGYQVHLRAKEFMEMIIPKARH